MVEIKQTPEFEKWEQGLRDRRARAIVAARILRLANGLVGDVAPIGEGVSELRIHYGPGYRVYFRKHGAMILLLLAGGDKSTQSRDINTAKQLAKEWKDL